MVNYYTGKSYVLFNSSPVFDLHTVYRLGMYAKQPSVTGKRSGKIVGVLPTNKFRHKNVFDKYHTFSRTRIHKYLHLYISFTLIKGAKLVFTVTKSRVLKLWLSPISAREGNELCYRVNHKHFHLQLIQINSIIKNHHFPSN